MRGRKPQPSAFKLLHGNRGHRPIGEGEPQPRRIMPGIPSHLGSIAVEEWQRLAPELHAIGVLTMVDRTALAAYCQLYEQWVSAEQYIKQSLVIVDKESGRIIQNPLLRISHRTLELMRGYMIELGLTPSSRVRLANGKAQGEDALGDFLREKRKPGRPRKEA